MCGYANSNAHIKILFQQTKYINCANSYMQKFWWEMIRMFTFPVLLLQYLGLCNILFMRNKRMIKKSSTGPLSVIWSLLSVVLFF